MTTLKTLLASGRFWAYVGSTLGAAVSIAANIAHSYVPPQQAADDWAPQPGAVVGAVVWPVFLFIAVEILARVAWPDGLTWQLLRWAGITPVAFVAAFVSYRHLSGLLAYYSEESLVSILGPLAVDGLMVMATAALIATSHTTPSTEPSTAEQPTTGATTGHPPANSTPTPGATTAASPSALTVPPAIPASDAIDGVPARLVSAARMITVQYRQTNNQPITADELGARLNISPAIAGQLLTAIDNPTPAPARINGNTPTLTGGAR
jgi:hypothetical protein